MSKTRLLEMIVGGLAVWFIVQKLEAAQAASGASPASYSVTGLTSQPQGVMA